MELTTSYSSVQEAMDLDPDILAAHVGRSRALHEQGELLMAGAFLDATPGFLEAARHCNLFESGR